MWWIGPGYSLVEQLSPDDYSSVVISYFVSRLPFKYCWGFLVGLRNLLSRCRAAYPLVECYSFRSRVDPLRCFILSSWECSSFSEPPCYYYLSLAHPYSAWNPNYLSSWFGDFRCRYSKIDTHVLSKCVQRSWDTSDSIFGCGWFDPEKWRGAKSSERETFWELVSRFLHH